MVPEKTPEFEPPFMDPPGFETPIYGLTPPLMDSVSIRGRPGACSLASLARPPCVCRAREKVCGFACPLVPHMLPETVPELDPEIERGFVARETSGTPKGVGGGVEVVGGSLRSPPGRVPCCSIECTSGVLFRVSFWIPFGELFQGPLRVPFWVLFQVRFQVPNGPRF